MRLQRGMTCDLHRLSSFFIPADGKQADMFEQGVAEVKKNGFEYRDLCDKIR